MPILSRSKTRFIAAATAALVALSVCEAAPVCAASDTELAAARELFATAMRQKKAGQYGQALVTLKRILVIKESYGVVYHMAVCEERLGQLFEARRHFLRAVKLAPPEAKLVHEKSQEALKRLLTKVPILNLQVPEPPPEGLRIWVNGEELPRAKWSLPVRVRLGRFKVEATAPRHEAFEVEDRVVAHDSRSVKVALKPKDEGPPPPPPPQTQPPAPPSKAPLYISGGVTIGAAVSAVTFLLLRNDLREETDQTCQRVPQRDPTTNEIVLDAQKNIVYIEPCDRNAREERISLYSNLSLASGVLTAAGLVTFSLFAFGSSKPKTREGNKVGVTSVNVSPHGFMIMGRF